MYFAELLVEALVHFLTFNSFVIFAELLVRPEMQFCIRAKKALVLSFVEPRPLPL